MASESIPITDVGSGYKVNTQVIPSSTAPTTMEPNSSPSVNPLQKFLKGEPKALGVVEIMNGLVMFLLGVVLMPPEYESVPYFVLLGFSVWGSFLHILGGSLAVSASNKLNRSMVKGAMIVNILSTITAALSFLILSVDLIITQVNCNGCGYRSLTRTSGIISVLLVFTLFQMAISISISAFSCKAVCSEEPPLSVITVEPDPK